MNRALTVCLGSSIVICDLKVQEVGVWLGLAGAGARSFVGAKNRLREAVSEKLRQARFSRSPRSRGGGQPRPDPLPRTLWQLLCGMCPPSAWVKILKDLSLLGFPNILIIKDFPPLNIAEN